MTLNTFKTHRHFVVLLILSCSCGCEGAKDTQSTNAKYTHSFAPKQNNILVDTRVLFGDRLITKYNLTDEDIKNIQYYLDGDLTLERQVSREYRAGRMKGKLVLRDGVTIEEIHIPSGTPGVCTNTNISTQKSGLFNLGTTTRRFFFISFEPGTNLEFSVCDDGLCRPCYNGDKDHLIFVGTNDRYLMKTGGSKCYLKVDEDSLRNVDTKKKTFQGVKLPG